MISVPDSASMMQTATPWPWENYVLQKLYNYQQKQLFCDTILEAADGVTFVVHGCIFAAASELLHSKLLKRTPEQFSVTTGVSSEVLSRIVRGVYCGGIDREVQQLGEVSDALRQLGFNLPTLQTPVNKDTQTTDESETVNLPTERGGEKVKDESDSEISNCLVTADDEHEEILHAESPPEQQEPESENSDNEASPPPRQGRFLRPAKVKLRASKTTSKRSTRGGKTHPCPHCGREFRHKSTMLQHTVRHTGDRPYPCTLCDKKYSYQGGLTDHMKNSHPDAEFTTRQRSPRKLNLESAKKVQARKPKRTRLGEGNTEIDAKNNLGKAVDGDAHDSQSGGVESLTTESPSKLPLSHICAVCNKVFKHRCSLQQHTATHTGVRRYNCPLCEQKYNLTSCLKAHFMTHTSNGSLASDMAKDQATGKFHCGVCKEKFTDETLFINHQGSASHMKHLRHVCNICSMRFNKRYLLTLHITGHKSPDVSTPNFLCSECGASFTSRSNLTIHQRIHTGEFPYKCSLCTKRFRASSNCRQHEKAHPENRKFLCRFCPKKFGLYRGLVDHERTHTKDEVFNCEYCSRTFTMKRFKLLHEKLHTGDHPFKCQFCPKAMPSRSQLTIHERRHTGERPFKCDVCGKGFVSLYGLRGHSITHTGEKPYQCSTCGTSFTKGSHLSRHIARFHAQPQQRTGVSSTTI